MAQYTHTIRTSVLTITVCALVSYVWYTEKLQNPLPLLRQLHNSSLQYFNEWKYSNQSATVHEMISQSYNSDWLDWLHNTTDNNTLHSTPATSIQPSVYSGINRLPGHNFAIAIYIRTGANEVLLRKAIRETWMREARGLGMTVLFVGATSSRRSDNWLMRDEAHSYGDMLVLDSFIDAYHNLSLKTREIMRWHEVNRHPQIPTIFMWTNIDGMVYPRNLIQYIHDRKVDRTPAVIHGQCTCSGLCRQRTGPRPQRGPKLALDKWGIPRSVYPWDNYPHYCMGYSILMAPGTVAPLVEIANSKTERWLMDNWIDDVTYTGIFMQLSTTVKLMNSGLFPGADQINGCGKCVAMHTKQTASNIRKQHADYIQYLKKTG